jgi:hypothetical protein
MNLCSENKKVDVLVREFIEHVGKIKEESITDYLVWQWKLVDKRFNYINVTEFDRDQENTITGADYEMELWLVGRSHAIPLVFQAKKVIKTYNGYKAALNYPENTQAQLKRLLKYAKSQRKLPFYMFYSVPDAHTESKCIRYAASSGATIFMADALEIKDIANSSAKKISKNDLLKKSNPFHCMFCCPLSSANASGGSRLDGLRRYFQRYFPKLTEMPRLSDNVVPLDKLNPTVLSLLEGKDPTDPPRRPSRIIATLKIDD